MNMELPPDTVLVFGREDDLSVFTSFADAVNYLEAIDVAEGSTRRPTPPTAGCWR